MRWSPSLLLLAACSPAGLGGRSGGIVSTNPCADAILIEVADPARIAAISHYSHRRESSSVPIAVARRFPATAGTAEEVIALAPDLVIADSFTPLATREAYVRAGIPTLLINSPATIAETRAQVAEIAAAVNAPQRGRALIDRIDQAVAEASWTGPPISALLWHGSSGLVSGSGVLIDEMLRRAGFRNAAADYGLERTGFLPLEHVVMDPPRVMLTPIGAERGLAIRHRAVERLGDAVVEAEYSDRLLNCAGPTIIPAMKRLAEVRRSIPKPVRPERSRGALVREQRPSTSLGTNGVGE